MSLGQDQQSLLIHAPALRKHITHRVPYALRRELDADDILQEVWERTLRTHDPSGITQITDLEQYLKRVASNVLVDRIRAFQTAKRGRGLDRVEIIHANNLLSSYADLFERVAGPRKTPSSEVAIREAAGAVSGAMERIPERQREAIRLYHILELPCDEVGQRMRLSERAVRSLVARGLVSLRNELGSATQFLSDAPSDVE
ncbi:MAG: sigma-70 family RNA polymerase sigma factor [Phycisphaerales bacterium]|nr:sigma-70 family RNA polymerase sigma factor [Phycisphaerales bacterium]